MKLNTDDVITILNYLNVNLNREDTVRALIEGCRFLGDDIGTNNFHSKINLYCLLGKFVDINNPIITESISRALNVLEQRTVNHPDMVSEKAFKKL